MGSLRLDDPHHRRMTCTPTSVTLLLLLCLSLLAHIEARPMEGQARVQLLKLLRRNMEEGKTSMRLAMTLEREMWRMARRLEESDRMYESLPRDTPEMVVEEEAGGGRRRQPFSPWAGR